MRLEDVFLADLFAVEHGVLLISDVREHAGFITLRCPNECYDEAGHMLVVRNPGSQNPASIGCAHMRCRPLSTLDFLEILTGIPLKGA